VPVINLAAAFCTDCRRRMYGQWSSLLATTVGTKADLIN